MIGTGRARELDDATLARMLEQVPGTTVHADLSGFADWLRDEHGQADSGPGTLT